MFWFRIDNRLIHGQVIETWLPYTQSRHLFVANDAIADDALQQNIMSMAIPSRIDLQFFTVEKLAAHLNTTEGNSLILFFNCQDARRAFEHGSTFKVLNVGNLHYGPGKKHICTHAAVSSDDVECLHFLIGHGVKLDFRCVPNDKPRVIDF